MSACDTSRHREMVSPAQAAIGSFFGGPIALACFVRSNYAAIGDAKAASRTTAVGLLLVVACNGAVALGILLPAPLTVVPTFVLLAIPFALMIAAYRIAHRQIESRSREYAIRSNARVFGIAALCLLASGVCALVTIVAALAALLASSGFRT